MAIEGRFLRSFPVLWFSGLLAGGETSPVDLASVVLGQRESELHDPRVLEGRQSGLHEILELTGQRVVAGAITRYHVGLGFDQSVGIFIPDDGAFRYRRVLK